MKPLSSSEPILTYRGRTGDFNAAPVRRTGWLVGGLAYACGGLAYACGGLAYACGGLALVALLGSGCGGDEDDDEGDDEGLVESVDASVCSSGQRWVGGDEESAKMHPGGDCIGCHANEGEGPDYSAAGTVYAELDATNDCFGVSGATIEIVDVDGTLHTAVSNDAGNFHFGGAIPTPYTARVGVDGAFREMLSPQTDLNCAVCHSAAGAEGAPGRVVTP